MRIYRKDNFAMKQAEKNRISTFQIISAAIDEFSKYGFSNASLNRICRENGISKGKLYHYFESKDDLYYQCINFIFFDFSHMLEELEVDKTKSVFDNLHNYYSGIIDYWVERPMACLLIKRSSIIFGNDELTQLDESQEKYISTAKRKFLEIIHSCGKSSVADDELFELVKAVNENLFMREISSVAQLALKGGKNEVNAKKSEIMAIYDRMINVLLHGIL